MEQSQHQPSIECPNCGHGLFTVDDASRLTGQSTRTLQRRLEGGAIEGAIRERVPGGFRWLISTDAIQGKVATVVPRLLEKVLPEIEAARDAEKRRLKAERVGPEEGIEPARRAADEALLAAIQRSREANEWFRELQGWVIDADSAPLIMALQRSGVGFRQALYAHSSTERLAAIDDLLGHLQEAIKRCRGYRPATSP